MFEFLQLYIKQTRVLLNSIYQIDIPPCCTRRHCRKQTYEWQHVIGRLYGRLLLVAACISLRRK